MQIVRDRPPNYAQIVAAFPHVARTHGVLFAYGDLICNPDGIPVTAALQAHEEVHGQRQAAYRGQVPAAGVVIRTGVEGWWDQYIADQTFRFQEEFPAHVAEYAYIVQTEGRNLRRLHLTQIAERLAGPLYGNLTTKDLAKQTIKAGARAWLENPHNREGADDKAA